MQTNGLKHNWTRDDVRAIYTKPLLDAVFAAGGFHPVAVDGLAVVERAGGVPEVAVEGGDVVAFDGVDLRVAEHGAQLRHREGVRGSGRCGTGITTDSQVRSSGRRYRDRPAGPRALP